MHSFLVSLINPPEEARYWLPIFYYRDPDTGIYTSYYPEELLTIGQFWYCPLSAGEGIMVDFRCQVYNGNCEIIGTKDLSSIVVRDGEEFVYNWGPAPEEPKGISPWAIASPIGIVAALGIAIAATKRR